MILNNTKPHIIILISLSLSYNAKCDNTIDSLKQIINSSTNDSVLADTYFQLSYELVYNDFNEAKKNCQISLDMSRKNGYDEIEGKCLLMLGVIYDSDSKSDSGLFYYQGALDIFTKLQDTLTIAYIQNNIGATYSDIYHDYEKSIEYYEKVLQILQHYKDSEKEAMTLGNIASSYYFLDDYETALNYLYKSLEIEEKNNLEHNVTTLFLFGSCYLEFNMYDKALDFYHTVLEKFKTEKNLLGEYRTHLRFVDIFFAKEQYDSVGYYLNKLKQFKEASYFDSFIVSVSFARYYVALDSLNQAEDYIILAEKELKVNKDKQYKLYHQVNKSNYYCKLNEIDKSLEALSSINEDSLIWQDNKFLLHNEFSKVYYQLGDFKKAHDHLLLASQFKDSLNLLGNRQLLIEKDITYKYYREKREQEINQEKLQLETELELSKKSRLNYIMVICLIFFHAITLIIYRNLRRKKKDNILLNKQKIAIEKKEQLAADLLQELNHRVKNNLQMVSSLFTMQLYSTKDTKIKQALTNAGNRLNSLIILHQHMYKQEYSLIPSMKEYLTDFCEKVIDTSGVKDKVILQLHVDNIKLNAKQSSHVGLMVNELLTNSLKYGVDNSRTDNKITISFRKESDKYKLEASNNIVTRTNEENSKNSSSFGLKFLQVISEEYNGYIKTNFTHRAEIKLTLCFNEQ